MTVNQQDLPCRMADLKKDDHLMNLIKMETMLQE